MDKSYTKCLAGCAAALSIKTIVVHLLGARSRLMAGSTVQPEDSENPLMPVLKMSLLCYGPDFGGQDFTQRCERIAKNAAENEPFFLVTSLLGGLSGLVPVGIGCQLINVYTYSRIGHAVTYLLGPKITSAPRALTWLAGSVSALGMAGVILKGLRS